MANEMRDRLVEYIENAKKLYEGDVTDLSESEYVAECLLSDGVIVPPCKVGDTCYPYFQDYSKMDVEYAIDHCPRADVVPVVRCEDCKHCRKPKGKERYRYFEGVLLCESYEMSDDVCAVNPDDYCSYGERRCSNG
jgi:hypothetical protein